MIRIYKAKRILEYIQKDGKVLHAFPISLGFSPIGDKAKEGDGKTPEGRYRIVTINLQSKYHISFGLSYPNGKDAKSARAKRILSPFVYARICLSSLLGLRPPWNTPLGGFIMIHGENPEGKTGDWTQGCIALSNRDVDLLYSLVKKGEEVQIFA